MHHNHTHTNTLCSQSQIERQDIREHMAKSNIAVWKCPEVSLPSFVLHL